MSDLEALADQLVEHRINGDFLPDTSLAAELDSHSEVFAVHERMMETGGSSALGEHVGWKVGATNEGMWSGMGLVEPLRAPIFASALSASPAVASKAADNLTVLEAEFAFKLKSPLAGSWGTPVTPEAAWDATEEVFLAIEICAQAPFSPCHHDGRFRDPAWAPASASAPGLTCVRYAGGSRYLPEAFAAASAYQRIADGGMNTGLVLGPSFSADEMRGRDLAGTRVALLRNGEVGVGPQQSGTSEGSGAAVLGDPVNSLCFLANALGRTGGSLEAGMIVTTGACCILGAPPGRPPAYEDGDTIVARFDGFGDVTLQLQSPRL